MRRPSAVLFALLLIAGCNRAQKNNEAIRQGVVEHLQKNSGLEIGAMNIEVTAVQYRGNEADATVSFSPKNAPGGGMSMNYTLESQGVKWVVKKREGSGAAGGDGMPAGHPPAGGAAPSGAMPPGHPPAEPPKAGNQDLPPGHPPVQAPGPVKPKPQPGK